MLSCSVVIASLSALLGSLDSAVNIAFPAITAAFSLEVTAIQWVVVGYVLNCARFAIGLLVPYYAIDVLRYPATTGGTLMLAAALMTTLAAPLTGGLADRVGTAGLSSLGLALEGLGLWMISRLDAQADYLSVAVALGVVGLGLGVFEAPNMSFVMGSISRAQQGVAGSIANMTRTLGIVFGATGASMIFDQRRQIYLQEPSVQGLKDVEAFVPAFQDVFVAAAGLCLVAFILSLFRRQETVRA